MDLLELLGVFSPAGSLVGGGVTFVVSSRTGRDLADDTAPASAASSALDSRSSSRLAISSARRNMALMLTRAAIAFLLGGVIAFLAGAFFGDSMPATVLYAGGIALVGAGVYYGYAAPLRDEQRRRSLRA